MKESQCSKNGRHHARRDPPGRPPGYCPRWLGVVLTAAFAALLHTPAPGVILSGSSRTSLYTQRVHRFPDTPLENQNQILESLRLDALRIGVPALSFHTSFTGLNNVNHESARTTRFRLYRGYLQYASAAGPLRYDARLGRQWVLAGVGTGVIDGATLGLSWRGIGGLDGFFGTLGPERVANTTHFWNIEKTSQSRTYGGRLRLQRALGPVEPEVAVSFAQADRKPHDVIVPSTRRLGVHGEVRLARPMSGGIVTGILEKMRAWGDYGRDMILGRDIRGAAGLEYIGGPRALRAWIEYNRRRPALESTSFFGSFDSRAVNHVRGGVSALIIAPLTLSVEGDAITFEDHKQEQGGQILLSAEGVTAGYRRNGVYGGALNGLVLFGHRTLYDKILLDAAVNVSEYKYDEIAGISGVDEHESTGILAAGYRLLRDLTLTAQVEAMRNAQFKHDVRFLGFVDWRFRAVL
jgi:hypothetical protein